MRTKETSAETWGQLENKRPHTVPVSATGRPGEAAQLLKRLDGVADPSPLDTLVTIGPSTSCTDRRGFLASKRPTGPSHLLQPSVRATRPPRLQSLVEAHRRFLPARTSASSICLPWRTVEPAAPNRASMPWWQNRRQARIVAKPFNDGPHSARGRVAVRVSAHGARKRAAWSYAIPIGHRASASVLVARRGVDVAAAGAVPKEATPCHERALE